MMRLAPLALLAVTAAASAALAAPPPGANLAGVWTFETGVFDTSCTIRGSLIVRAPDAAGAQPCEIRAIETCTEAKLADGSVLAPLEFDATQSCTVSQAKGLIAIRSKVVRASTSSYQPDEFDLRLESSNRMRGQFYSPRNSETPLAGALFVRGEAPIP